MIVFFPANHPKGGEATNLVCNQAKKYCLKKQKRRS